MKKSREKKDFRLGVTGKMILNITVPTVAILLILGAVVTAAVMNAVLGVKSRAIDHQIEAAANQITQYFEPYFVNEKFVRDSDSVKEIFAELEKNPSAYRFDRSPHYAQVMEELKDSASVGGDAVQSVWIAGVSNSHLIQSDGYVSDDSFRITERVWYKLLEQNPGRSILSPAYEEISTGKLVVTLATAYTNSTGKIIGVIGIDLSTDELAE